MYPSNKLAHGAFGLANAFVAQYSADSTGTAVSEAMSGLPREVIKWLQSLDLTYPIRNVRRDFSNGYLVAEVFSWYYPQQIEMYSFSNGASLQTKLGNWQQLERFFAKEGLDIPKEYIEGTIHCKPAAATSLLERAYTLLTHKKLHYLPSKSHPQDFNDSIYQSQLLPHARSTASQSVKNNLTSTELSTEPDRIVCKQKAEAILETYVGQRRLEKEEFPERFGLRTTKAGKSACTSRANGGHPTATGKGLQISREVKVKQRRPEKL